MAGEIQTIPTGTGYEDWAQNLQPIISSWLDLKKYQMSQNDENKRAAMTAMLQSGAMQPNTTPEEATGTGATNFGGFGMHPLDLAAQLYRSGKGMEMQKTLMDMMKTQADTEGKQMENQTMSGFLGTNPRPMMGNIGGVLSVPAQAGGAAPSSSIMDFFRGNKAMLPSQQAILAMARKSAPGLSDEVIINALKQSGQWPTK